MLGRTALLSLCSSLLLAISYAIDAETKQSREMAKPWLMRNIEVGGVKMPFSPAGAIAIFVLLVNLYHAFVNPNWAEASHILIKDPSNKTKQMMTEMKKEIGTDLRRFGDFAAKYSQCPSKAKKGDLGRFKPGDMAPPFDKVIFDPKSATETALGPVQTQFGWHLIYIRQRKI